MNEKHQKVLDIIESFSGSSIDQIYFQVVKAGAYTNKSSIGNVLRILSIQNRIKIDGFRVFYVG